MEADFWRDSVDLFTDVSMNEPKFSIKFGLAIPAVVSDCKRPKEAFFASKRDGYVGDELCQFAAPPPPLFRIAMPPVPKVVAGAHAPPVNSVRAF